MSTNHRPWTNHVNCEHFLDEGGTSEGMNGKPFGPLNILLLKYAALYLTLCL